MTSSLRVMENEVENCYAFAKTPLTRSSQISSMKFAAQSSQTVHANRPEEFFEQAFASFLEVAPDAVVVADRDGRIIRVNAQTERMFQYSRTELLGRQIEILIPERFRERHVQQRAAYSAEPTMRPMGVGQRQLYGLRKDGQEFPVEISLGVLPTEAGFLIASAIRDVSEQRRLEEELSERTRQLEEANRNKDEFLGMLAHELRNPLAATSMAVEVLRHSSPIEDPKQLWDIISRQTLQMLHLVNDLMDVSRIAHGKVRIQKVPVDLDPLIRQAIEAVQPLLNANKQPLTVSLPPRPLQLLADPVRLVEVFTNLLNNAAKYTDNGGQILLIAAKVNDEVVVEFRDTGIGIPIEMLPHIFDPFTQVTGALNRSEGGIGIGLAMVAHLVRLHDGTVQVFSDGPGRGSRFLVRLPAYIPSPQITLPLDEGASALSGRRIPVVDDDKDSADSLKMLLRLKGNHTRPANDGLKAVDVA